MPCPRATTSTASSASFTTMTIPWLHLLKASRAALTPGGCLLIVEPMAANGSAPEGHAYFGFYLAAMRSGRPRTPDEITSMLQAAGFRRIRRLATPLPLVASCVVAFT